MYRPAQNRERAVIHSLKVIGITGSHSGVGVVDNPHRVKIDRGPRPFQILQQDGSGFAAIRLAGRWQPDSKSDLVQARITHEDDQTVVLGWESAQLQGGDAWQHVFEAVPAGGLYRIATRVVLDGTPAEWGLGGDVIHHVGVGDLWVIAGQSNAAGYGRGAIVDPPELGVHILKNNETWDVAAHPLNDATGNSHPNTEIANPGHSPYLSFARILRASLGYPIGLIQTSLGNSRLSQWNPAENPDAPLYQNLLHCVRLAGGQVRGMLWYQGESDTNPDLAESYERRFAQFVGRLRSDLNAPTLPIIVAQLNRYTGRQSPEEHRGWSQVREAQRNARKLPNVAVVPTLDLPLSDDCHTSPAGNLMLANRKADAALSMVGGKRRMPQIPDVVEAVLAIDSRSIDLRFAAVSSRLQFLAPGETDFAVEDEKGFAIVQRAECVAPDRVRLDLDRAVSANARIHGGFGANPTASLRDVEENTPALAFYGLACTGSARIRTENQGIMSPLL